MAFGNTEKHVLTAFILICGYTANGFICAAFVRCHRLQTVTNYFVVNLAASGLISFICLTTWKLQQLIPENVSKNLDDFYFFLQSFDIFAASLSAASVTAIAFDRYYAVSRPLRYSTYVTHTKALFVLAGVWAYAHVIALMTWFRKLDPTRETFSAVYMIVMTLYNFVVAFVLCLFCYISIFLLAWPHLQQNSALQHYAPDSRGFALAKHLKITFTILVLSVPLMFGWSVFYIISSIEHFLPSWQHSNAGEYIVSMLPNIIAAINPIIYICLTKDFRRVALKWIRCGRDRVRGERLTTMQSLPPSVAV